MSGRALALLKTLPDKEITNLLMDIYEEYVVASHRHQYERSALILKRNADGHGKVEVYSSTFKTLVIVSDFQDDDGACLYLKKSDGGSYMFIENEDDNQIFTKLRSDIRKNKIVQALK
jgi:hypothetical protein